MPVIIGSPVIRCAGNPPAAEQPSPPKKDETHFINFNIVDDKGAPLANVTLNVTLPDGSVEEKTSDKDGKIEIKNIKPGNCKIESDWKKLKVDDVVLIQN